MHIDTVGIADPGLPPYRLQELATAELGAGPRGPRRQHIELGARQCYWALVDMRLTARDVDVCAAIRMFLRGASTLRQPASSVRAGVPGGDGYPRSVRYGPSGTSTYYVR